MTTNLSLLIVDVLFLALVVLALHRISPRYGLTPLIALAIVLTVFVQASNTSLVYIQLTNDFFLFVAPSVCIPIILMTILILYIAEGTIIARLTIFSILGASLFYYLLFWSNKMHLFLTGGGSFLNLTPDNPTLSLYLPSIVASLIAFTADLFIIAIVYQGIKNNIPQLPTWVAPGIALLVSLWSDTVFYQAFCCGLPTSDFFVQILDDLLSKTMVGIVVWPMIAVYLTSFVPITYIDFRSSERRPTFDLLFGPFRSIEVALARSEASLQESEERFRSFIEQSSDGFLLTDERGNIIEYNQAQKRLTGFTRQECIGLPLWDFQLRLMPSTEQTPEARQYFKQATTSALQSGQVDFMDKMLEVEILRKDGTKLFVQTRAFGIKTKQGYRLGSIARNVTEQKRLEALTHLRLRLLEFAENHSKVELLRKTLDEVGELTDSPIGFYHFLEEDQKTLTLQAWSTQTMEEFCQAEGEGLHYPIDQAGVWAGAVRQRRPLIHNDYSSLPDRKGMPEGHASVIRELVVPIQRDDRVVAVLGVGNKPQEYTDKDLEIVSYLADVTWELTERKQAEQEREELIKKLEAQNAELERFTYTVSHDLKSPLITINGFIGYLEGDATSGNMERLRGDIQRIQDAVEKMKRLLDELLELSRIGRLMNPPEDVPFGEVAQDVLEILHGQLEARGVAVTLSPNLPTVYGDRHRLIEVLQNLVDNAAKFMGDQPNPHIEIGQQGEENGKPILYVKDNGISIPPEYHERIFGLFERLDARDEGTGIGLALVKRIVEFHGGRIWVESEAGEGATFYFTLEKRDDIS